MGREAVGQEAVGREAAGVSSSIRRASRSRSPTIAATASRHAPPRGRACVLPGDADAPGEVGHLAARVAALDGGEERLMFRLGYITTLTDGVQ